MKTMPSNTHRNATCHRGGTFSRMCSNAHPLVTAGLSALLLLVSACAPQDSASDVRSASEDLASDLDDADWDADEANIDYGSIAATPYIHLRQTAVFIADGKPMDESLYREISAGCRQMEASVPVKLLRDEDIGKLGRTYFEAWYQGLRMAVRSDTWGYVENEDASCQVTLAHESKLRIVTPEGRWDIDLGERTGEFWAGPDYVRAPLSKRDGEYESAAARNDALADLAREAKMSGMSDVLIPKPAGTLHIAGRSCDVLRYDVLQGSPFITCQWNEGRDWGFGFGESDWDWVNKGIDAYAAGIQLSRHFDGVQGIGPTLVTDEMTVGEPFNDSVFEVPSGITIKVNN